MNVVGLAGWSGSGKTLLGERLTAALRAAGCSVSVVKHAHKGFDIDIPGKDSYRHRAAGAFEVVVGSGRRIALLREAAHGPDPASADQDITVYQLLAELTDLGSRHWVLVEGFRHAELPKVEVWRDAKGGAQLWPNDAHVVAIAHKGALPLDPPLPLFDLDDAAGIARFLLQDAQRYEYRPV